MAMAVVVVGLLAVALWTGEEDEPLRINCEGVCTSHLSYVRFTITNRSQDSFLFIRSIENDGTVRRGGGPKEVEVHEKIACHSATNWEVFAEGANRWRIGVRYGTDGPELFSRRVRAKFAQYAMDHDWVRLSLWVAPPNRWRYASGPEMIGKKPASASSP
jgi:hypothetical protein